MPPSRLSSIPLQSIQYVRGSPSGPMRRRAALGVVGGRGVRAAQIQRRGRAPVVPFSRLLWLIVVSGEKAEDREPPSDPRPSAGVVSVLTFNARRTRAGSSVVRTTT